MAFTEKSWEDNQRSWSSDSPTQLARGRRVRGHSRCKRAAPPSHSQRRGRAQRWGGAKAAPPRTPHSSLDFCRRQAVTEPGGGGQSGPSPHPSPGRDAPAQRAEGVDSQRGKGGGGRQRHQDACQRRRVERSRGAHRKVGRRRREDWSGGGWGVGYGGTNLRTQDRYDGGAEGPGMGGKTLV